MHKYRFMYKGRTRDVGFLVELSPEQLASAVNDRDADYAVYMGPYRLEKSSGQQNKKAAIQEKGPESQNGQNMR